MAGYSKRSLVAKLGMKAGSKVSFINPPDGYDETLGELPPDITITGSLKGPLDFVQCFVREKAALEAKFPVLKAALAYDGMLWISWPKKAAKVETDLNENIVREIGLANGLVDVKVCAVDETWSGLKFVYRSEDRK
jgi:hypothetical protein